MFGNRINSYTYNTQTPVYNMMFSVKYLMQTDASITPSDNLYTYCFTTSDDRTNVYENNYFLPISYCVNENIKLWNTEEGNPFDVQNEYFELATGYSNVFKTVEFKNTEYDNVSGDNIINNGTYWFSKYNGDSTYGYADITVSPKTDGNVYLYVSSPDIKSLEVSSDTLSSHTQQIEEPYILDMGYYSAGDEIKISLDCGSADSDECYAEIYVYSADSKVLESGYKKLAESSLNIEQFSDTKIEGTITVTENSCLYSSIPYDKGWKVYIDGEEAESFEIGGAMLGTMIKPGEHTVEYRYVPRGMTVGIIISGATLAGVCGYMIYEKLKRKSSNSELS